jgi:hypothetical protein
MYFDAAYFINLCQKKGFTLTRKGGLLCYNYEGKRIAKADYFIDVMRLHKAEIIPLLEDSREPIQLDMFGDNA